jgi:hypothetical protein
MPCGRGHALPGLNPRDLSPCPDIGHPDPGIGNMFSYAGENTMEQGQGQAKYMLDLELPPAGYEKFIKKRIYF